jgi:hypothetical protein
VLLTGFASTEGTLVVLQVDTLRGVAIKGNLGWSLG